MGMKKWLKFNSQLNNQNFKLETLNVKRIRYL